MDFMTDSADALLRRLEWAGRTPPLDLIEACLARQEELTPGLLKMFAESLHDEWEDGDPRWYRIIHAGRLLIAYREPAALSTFEKLYRDDELSDWLEWFETDPYYFGPVAIPTFAKMLAEDTGEEWNFGKALSVGVLAQIGLHFPEAREDVLGHLRKMLPAMKADGSIDWPADQPPDEIWHSTVFALADLKDVESKAQVSALFDNDMIDPWFGDKEDYLKDLDSVIDSKSHRRRAFDIVEQYLFLHHQAERKREGKRDQARKDAMARSAKLRRSSKKVGRNEPCPCGSERKYKHCCGKRG